MRRSKGFIAAAAIATVLWTSGVFSATAQAPDLRDPDASRWQAPDGGQAPQDIAGHASFQEDEAEIGQLPTDAYTTQHVPQHNNQTSEQSHSQADAAAPDDAPLLPDSAIGDDSWLPGQVTEQQNPGPEEPSQDQLGPYAGSLPQALDSWLDALSAEPRFQDWASAARSISPIGPGTHGWIVILSRDQHEIGYLVVHADEAGRLVLGEYGTGPHALFSLKALKQHLQWNGLAERAGISPEQLAADRIKLHYSSPAEALFVIETADASYTVNAKNGEWYALAPALQLEGVQEYMRQKGRALAHIDETMKLGSVQSRHVPAFDAFEHTLWLDGQQLLGDSFDELAARLDRGERVIAATEAFGEVLVTWPIIGYHLWNGDIPYLIAEDEGERYVPFDSKSIAYYVDAEASGH